MKKVYGYIRVSTAKQGEGVSLTVQKEAISRYAQQYNLDIVRWFEEKETAAKQGRPLFNAMMKLLKDKKAVGVIIHKIDRSARNLKDWADLGNLIDQGVEVHFAHESLDLQARGGRLSADIQAVIAADYIRNLRQEAIKGLYGRLKQGIYPFKAPLGYLDSGKGKCKIIDPVRGPLVKKAFELYETKKYSLITLVEKLGSLGLKNQNDSKVKVSNISNILNNPFYTGIIRVKKTTFNGLHAPLISTKLFQSVQAVLRGNTNQKIIKHDFRYRKLVTCKSCGYSMIPEIQKGHVYYRCHSKNCSTTGIRENLINSTILRYYRGCELHPVEYTTLKELLNETEKDWSRVQQELHTTVTVQIGHLKQKLDRLTDVYLESGLDKDTFERKKEQLLLDLKTKEQEEKNILNEKQQALRKVEKFLELTKSLINSHLTGNPQEQRELLETTTSNLCVEGKKLVISMCSPFLELCELMNIHCGGLDQDAPRIMHTEFVDSNNSSPHMRLPLSKEKLKHLFDLLLSVISQLPHDNNESNYGI